MLPDIRVSLPIILGLWCISAWFAFEGPVMFAYPAMWLVVGILFWGLDRAFRGSRPATGTSPAAKKPEKKIESDRAAGPSSSFDAA